MIPISHIEVPSGGQAVIQFDAIPQTYSDLKIILSARSTADVAAGSGIYWANLQLQPNGSSSGLSTKSVHGFSTSTVSSNSDTNPTGGFGNGSTATASIFSNVEIYIPRYSLSTPKSWSVNAVTETNGTQCIRWFSGHSWTGTSPITSISLDLVEGDFVQYSNATLYGIKPRTAP